MHSYKWFIALPAGIIIAHALPAVSRLGMGGLLFPVIRRVDSSDSVVLTFDDGPDVYTVKILDVLSRYDTKAVFFVVGEQVERHPNLLREVVAAGHEIGIHGYRHVSHLLRAPLTTIEDVRRCKVIIEDTTGVSPRYIRPPYGVFSLASWVESVRQGWMRVLWSRWGKDWMPEATPLQIAQNIGTPEAGDIILLHDSDRYSYPGAPLRTIEAIPIILQHIADKGMHTTLLCDLV
ncbi:polysaccharide deacetylase [Thermobaculum terrenum ATCC BAA-798]|uniref:Polysaccharide deacetylase n=1 Tax=Thermobaculum terrenum (strain ATCC BAA-798 / CCMEE 7001 / YNP1) TaxID=525904 RepID=D1CF61_THET1|nr:polysaccharide deacetylase [Thermobaculum terrenum ATCC BAA-798]